MTHPVTPRRALISVSDKSGLVEFATRLIACGVEILSTGGTAQALRDAGIAVKDVSEHTAFPEIMGGRVKTLHPKIHGGILGRRGSDDAVMHKHDIAPIDLVIVNLYPFRETIDKPGVTLEEAVENIDIGGPALVRAAAKNYESVGVVVSPADYPEVITAIERGAFDLELRQRLMAKAFDHTADYDRAIANHFTPRFGAQADGFPQHYHADYQLHSVLRYGENPHQRAAFYRDIYPAAGSLSAYKQLQGKELSYNNIADADAAWEAVKSFDAPACVIVKHANPCGVAIASNTLDAYKLAYATDTTSAFGGIIAFNREVDGETVKQITDNQFMEVLMAPKFTAEALEIAAAKKNVRVLEVPLEAGANRFELKRVGGGLLVQTPDIHRLNRADLKVVSKRQPTEQEWNDLMFVWNVAKYVKSNAIVFGKGGQTYGIGAGQMSRVDSTRIAARKAQDANLDLNGACAASDAFFPFRDGVDVIAEQGIKAIIHPAGSMRDQEVFDAADEHGIAMVVTGIRHFRH